MIFTKTILENRHAEHERVNLIQFYKKIDLLVFYPYRLYKHVKMVN